MNIKHFNIMVTEQECGHARASREPADLTAYLLDRLPHKPELLRPAVVLCPGGGYGFVSPREDQPVAMEFLAAGCQVFSLHYSVAPETFPVALMELENIRILKEMRGSVNRQVNCETANINKTVSAAVKQMEDIIYIRDKAGLDSLPDNLREIAELRLARPEATLKELGEALDPPVGKSGVNHRLRKLGSMAELLRQERPDTGV
mgnify:CR=1 FL=1